MNQQQQRAMVPATAPTGPTAIAQWGMQREQLDLLKRTIAKGTTDDEFALFMTVAQRRGLDPFDRQIHAVKRWDSTLEREVMSIQIGIDGYRLGATRTGEDDGQEGPFWCGPDRQWVDVWLSEEAPLAAKVIAYRKGRARGYVGIALWASYVQVKKDGTPNAMWRRHGPGQLAKCAEALAIRKAFPQELGGTHTEDELGADAIDAEFTELRPMPTTPAAAPARPPPAEPDQRAAHRDPPPMQGSGNAAGEVGDRTATGKPNPPAAMTEAEEEDLITAIGNCSTEAALKTTGRRIPYAGMPQVERERWAKMYEDQLAEIKRAAAAEKATPA